MNRAEWAILHQIHYEPRDARVAPEYALRLLQHTGLILPTQAECFAAIRSLCHRGFVRIVDSSVQREIIRYLNRRKGIGPIDGLPFVGETDLTLKGAEYWRAWLSASSGNRPEDYHWHYTGDFVYRRNTTQLIFHRLECLERERACFDFVPVGPVEEIGIWRRQWWREIPTGYRQRCKPVNS